MTQTSPRPHGTRWTFLDGLESTRLRAGLAVPVIIVGVGGGLIGAAYLAALRLVTEWIGPGSRAALGQTAIMVTVGIAIALITRLLGDSGNVELLVDNIHVLGGAEDLRQIRPLIPQTLLCVGAGGAMGPEAPLVQTSGAFGTWVAGRFRLDAHDMRVLTITGMAGGFSILFGAPLGAALFALEILHKRGLQYYEALVPALVGALIGFALNFGLTGLGLEPVWKLPAVGELTGGDLLWGVACGVIGAGGALLFAAAARLGHWAVSRVPVAVLPAVGGAILVFDVEGRQERGSLSGSEAVRSVAVEGKKAYVALKDDIRVIDISDPDSPELEGEIPDAGRGLCSMTVKGGVILVASDGWYHEEEGAAGYCPVIGAEELCCSRLTAIKASVAQNP